MEAREGSEESGLGRRARRCCWDIGEMLGLRCSLSSWSFWRGGNGSRGDGPDEGRLVDMIPLVGGLLKEESELSLTENNNPFASLPGDVLVRIFQYLSGAKLCELSTVCRLWINPCRSNLLWKRLCIERWSERPFTKHLDLPLEAMEEGVWKSLFQEQVMRQRQLAEMRKSLSIQSRIRQNECDIQYKVVLLGAGGVGKTNILTRLTRDDFDGSSAPTVGMEFATRMMEIHQKLVKCQLWDIGTSESTNRSTRLLSSTYCRGAVGAFIVFDITDRSSFEKVEEFVNLWKDCKSRQFQPSCILLGQKSDLYRQRVVTSDEAEQLVQTHQLDDYLEVSALSNINIEEALFDLLNACYKKSSQAAHQFDGR